MEDSERKAYLDIITKLMDVLLAVNHNNNSSNSQSQMLLLQHLLDNREKVVA